jgi:hypothetical protein
MPEMTYDPTPADVAEFSAEELDSLQVGQQVQEAEAQMLAGKYENAEQLEKAYLELQQKLGERNSVSEQAEPEGEQLQEEEEAQEETQEVTEYSETEQFVLDATAEWEEKGELSDETYQMFTEMSSQDLVDAYMNLYEDGDAPQQEARDLTDSEVNQIQNFAGGQEAYGNLMQWASENVAPQYVEAFDQVVDSGDPAVIQLAVAGLMATQQEQQGYEGRMYSGSAAREASAPAFRSQAELVAAMNDPRYDSDPAYRQDVFDALSRSELNM